MAVNRAPTMPHEPIDGAAPADVGVRWIEPLNEPVEKATDLGSVQVLKHGNMYLLTDQFGDIHSDSRGLGLYLGDTRILSCAVLRIGGVRPVLLQGSMGGNYRGTIHLTNPSIDRNPDTKMRPEEALPGRKLGVTRDRLVGGDVYSERIRIVNHSEHDEELDLHLELADDGADIFEVRGYPRAHRGQAGPTAVARDRITFTYDGVDGRRRHTHVTFSSPPDGVEDPRQAAGPRLGGAVRASWTIALEPGGRTEITWRIWSTDESAATQDPGSPPVVDTPVSRLFPAAPHIDAAEGAEAYAEWAVESTTVSTDHELFNLTLNRSLNDLRLLLNDGPGDGEHYVAAGVPWFTTLFGRDSIITALESLAFRPQIAIQTLTILADRQATELDADHDAEPGKILHELRTGEMARSEELPFTPYFGSIDSTPLWLILLGATFDWIGDRALVDRLWPNALAALEWIDRYGDRDGDGFVEYGRRAQRGLYNQGWKDSADSIRDRDGRESVPPIALAEVQGYVFAAKRAMARLATMRGEHELARRLVDESDALRTRFDEAFWMPDVGYYAMALDADKNQASALSSNPGHCLWSGIVSPERARPTADRLLEPGLFSGWGVRTYAAGQPGYNPIGYHTGSVWPHDTAIVAAGMKRYGFHDDVNLLTGSVFEAAQRFPDFRLPELFCGFPRERSPMPVPYPVACSPQAWSAGASFLILQTMLGIEAHADRRELELQRPHLPSWLGKVTMSNLRIGDAQVDLLFHRWRGTTSA
jgi:glycogen debranching enzyme